MQADVLLTGAAIYTMDAAQPRGKNLAVAGGKIVLWHQIPAPDSPAGGSA